MDNIGLERGIVRLIQHNPNWKQLFNEESKKLRIVLKNYFLDIQHIGSTAIPGIIAKPIIDIAIALKSLKRIEEIIIIMEKAGYTYRGEMGIPERHLFVKGSDEFRTHHIHLMLKTHYEWESHQFFRDYLTSHPKTALKYEKLKKNLKEKYEFDREKYTEGKSTFIRSIIKKSKNEKD